ncbi:hypothetical protein BO99DRAFT_63112 [Aspergillus violaceofuscus CBS 115571]|uniref:Uncharacterized protein n=1 Tax=Aspergillus violaceofuscus (strain CBS 115571) TaxID=1450538 RepID=A0A2V5HBL0_ASPV1|nr:hypothetical protein BO99DRAFT_63112 [Aspergillus violaceofuscus CBS 115571]
MESSIDYRPKPLLTSSKHPQTSSISITHPSIPQIHWSKRAWESTHPTTTTREAYLHPPGCIPPHPSHTLLHPTIPPPRSSIYTSQYTPHLIKPTNQTPEPYPHPSHCPCPTCPPKNDRLQSHRLQIARLPVPDQSHTQKKVAVRSMFAEMCWVKFKGNWKSKHTHTHM